VLETKSEFKCDQNFISFSEIWKKNSGNENITTEYSLFFFILVKFHTKEKCCSYHVVVYKVDNLLNNKTILVLKFLGNLLLPYQYEINHVFGL